QAFARAEAHRNYAVQDAIDNARGQVISMSFGTCESLLNSLQVAAFQAGAQQANAQGITLIAASGDSGATGCDAGPSPVSPTPGAVVSLPASIPEVTAVGGTQLDDSGGSYWTASNSH